MHFLDLFHSLSDDSLKHSAAAMLQMQLKTATNFHIFSPHFSYLSKLARLFLWAIGWSSLHPIQGEEDIPLGCTHTYPQNHQL